MTDPHLSPSTKPPRPVQTFVSQIMLILAAAGLAVLACYLISNISGSDVTKTVTTTVASGTTPAKVTTETNGVALPSSLINTTIIAAAALAALAGFYSRLQSLKLPGIELDAVTAAVPDAIAADPSTKNLPPEKQTKLTATTVQIAGTDYAKSKLPAKDITTLALRDAKTRLNII